VQVWHAFQEVPQQGSGQPWNNWQREKSRCGFRHLSRRSSFLCERQHSVRWLSNEKVNSIILLKLETYFANLIKSILIAKEKHLEANIIPESQKMFQSVKCDGK
jgi:hypothetical protein